MRAEATKAIEQIIALARDNRKRKSGSEKQEASEPPRPLVVSCRRQIDAQSMHSTGCWRPAVGIQDKTQAPLPFAGKAYWLPRRSNARPCQCAVADGTIAAIIKFFRHRCLYRGTEDAADAEAMWPIRKREATLRDLYRPQRQNYENLKEAWEHARKHAINSGKGERDAIKIALDKIGPGPEEPLRRCSPVRNRRSKGWSKLLPRVGPASAFSPTKAACSSAVTE